MSFLSAFKSVFHAIEAGAQIAAPFVAIANPLAGQLILQATRAAVLVESTVDEAKKGDIKKAAVQSSVQATLDIINGILVSQGKSPISQDVMSQVQAATDATVAGLNAVSQATTGAK